MLLQFNLKYDVLGELILSGLPTPQTLFKDIYNDDQIFMKEFEDKSEIPLLKMTT